jgi:hypothetical protein
MFRLYDFECTSCGWIRESVVQFDTDDSPPTHVFMHCPMCDTDENHKRIIVSMPAPYMGEKVLNPMVSGGQFDTVGNAPVAKLPDIPKGLTDDKDISYAHRELFNSPEWKEAKAQRREDNRKNSEKRKRAAAIKAGANVNMRTDKCAGDPKLLS